MNFEDRDLLNLENIYEIMNVLHVSSFFGF